MTNGTPDLPGLAGLTPLGHGAFADVYLARQAHLERYVAAKVFRVPLADRQASDQFRAECRALGRLPRYPNIIAVYGADVLPDGRPYLIMEHCDSSLHKLVEARGPLPSTQAAELGLATARALLLAHGEGILHGDVTPQNILLRGAAPVVADFGLSVLRDYRGNVASGFTIAHAAPETVRNDGAIDQSTDVYGLGSTLYTAVTGHPPFPARLGETDTDRIHRALHEAPASPAGAPSWLADLLVAMLAKTPADRPTMTETADALVTQGAGRTGGAPIAPPPPIGPPDAPPGFPDYREPPDQRRDGRSGEGTRPRPDPHHNRPDADRHTDEETRLRPDSNRRQPPTPHRRRTPILVAGGAVAAAVAGVLTYVLWPAEPDPLPPDTKVHIQLQAPVDHGDRIDLAWTSDAPVTFDVLVGRPGQQPQATIVGRQTSYTVDVEPNVQYCFRVQGTIPSGTTFESNVQPVRDAVCRFDP